VAAPPASSAPAVSGMTAVTPPSAGAVGARRPSPRLTWVLEMLRQLDAAAVAV
jgi:hypothetical protein